MNKKIKIFSGVVFDFIFLIIFYFVSKLIHSFKENLISYDNSNIPNTYYFIWILIFF